MHRLRLKATILNDHEKKNWNTIMNCSFLYPRYIYIGTEAINKVRITKKTDFSETRDDRNKGGWLLVIVLRGMRCLFWNLSYQESIVCNSCLYSNYLYDSMDKGRSDNWAPQSFRHDLPGEHIHKYCFLSVLPRRTQKPVHFR